jgi:hypothetical protein
MINNRLKALVQETMYKIYMEHHPVLVDSIRQLLLAGEDPASITAKIKKYIDEQTGGHGAFDATVNNISLMIDYLKQQTHN